MACNLRTSLTHSTFGTESASFSQTKCFASEYSHPKIWKWQSFSQLRSQKIRPNLERSSFSGKKKPWVNQSCVERQESSSSLPNVASSFCLISCGKEEQESCIASQHSSLTPDHPRLTTQFLFTAVARLHAATLFHDLICDSKWGVWHY